MYGFREILGDAFTANNMIVNATTSVVFIICLVILFWAFISRHIEFMAYEKLGILGAYLEANPGDRGVVNGALKIAIANTTSSCLLNETSGPGLKSCKSPKSRIDYLVAAQNTANFKTLAKYTFAVIFGLAAVAVGIAVFIYTKRRDKFERDDAYLLGLTVTAFIAEIVFFEVVVRQWQIIEDSQALGLVV